MFFTQPKDQYIYLFQHVPKCAGTTIIDHIEKKLKSSSLNLEKKYATKCEVWASLVRQKPNVASLASLHGHRVFYGLHKISDRQPRYYTFLRNPVDRLVSLYNYWADSKIRRPIMYRDGQLISFREFIQTEYATNNMIRFLYHAMEGELTPGSRLDMISEHHVMVAKKFLEKCWFIGFVESFEQDFKFINACLGIEYQQQHKRVSKRYFDISQDAEAVDELLKLNQSDVEIFEYAKALRQSQPETGPAWVTYDQ